MTRVQSNAAFSLVTSVASSTNIVQMQEVKTRILINENDYPWSDDVKKQLEELIQLPYGWDGYQGVHVSFENATFTLRMLEAICGLKTITPQIVPGIAGDLQIEWHTLKGDIELHVKKPNDVHAWYALADGDPDGEEMELTNNFAPIESWVRKITEPPIGAKSTAA